jgi:arylformamidase
VTGHSAGGHLTASMFATDWTALGAAADLVPVATAISGLFDLEPLRQTAMNQDFRLDAVAARSASPLFWPPPAGRTIDVLVGGAETNEFRQQSRTLADSWRKAGVMTRYHEIPGANHFTAIEPLADPQSAMVGRFVELAHQT